jgi:hypothetical protein
MRIRCHARPAARPLLTVSLVALALLDPRTAHASEESAFTEIETKYIFG